MSEVNEVETQGPAEAIIAARPNAEAIASLKEKHGTLQEVEVDGWIAILRRPKIVDLERAFKASQKPNAKQLDFNRNIVANCKVYIDAGFEEDDEREQALLTAVNDIVELKQAHVKKL